MRKHVKTLIHVNHLCPCSGCTWPSWPKGCRPQLQASPVVFNQTSGAEHPRGRVRHSDYGHEVEDGISYLFPGGVVPHHRGNSVQSAWTASRELPETGHSYSKAGLLGCACMCKLLGAGRAGPGRWKLQCHNNNPNLFCCAGLNV